MRRIALVCVMVVGMAGGVSAQQPAPQTALDRWCGGIKDQRDRYEFFMAQLQVENAALKAENELLKKSAPAKDEKKK
jgi:hypothetical protein